MRVRRVAYALMAYVSMVGAAADAQNTPPNAVFQTLPPDSNGRVEGPSPLSVMFNLCRSRDVDEDDLKYTYDFDGDGTVDSFGHCRQTFEYKTDGRDTACHWRPIVCVWDRQPFDGHQICRQYEVCTFKDEIIGRAQLYAANGGGEPFPGPGSDAPSGVLYIVDPNSASASAVGPISTRIAALAVHPTTKVLWGTSANGNVPHGLYRIDTQTGAGQSVGWLAVAGGELADLAFGPDGTLYGFNKNTSGLARVDLNTGLATAVGSSEVPFVQGSGLTFSLGGTLYFAGAANGPLLTLDPATGAPSSTGVTLSGMPAGYFVTALTTDSTGRFLGVVRTEGGPPSLVQIDPTTGVITPLGALPTNVFAVEWAAP